MVVLEIEEEQDLTPERYNIPMAGFTPVILSQSFWEENWISVYVKHLSIRKKGVTEQIRETLF